MVTSDFFDQIMNDFNSTDNNGDSELSFTYVMFNYLEAVDEFTEPIICSFKDRGIQINGLCNTDDFSRVDVFITLLVESKELTIVSKSDVTAALNRGYNFYRKSMQNLSDKIPKGSDAYACFEIINTNISKIKNVRIILLTNGLVKDISIPPITSTFASISFSIWDIERLFKSYSSSQKREPIDVDLVSKLGRPLAAIKGGVSPRTDVYLSILPGKLLADLYEEHGPKLLERNVRSFLQMRGKPNKGLRETLINEPEMFLAYNNGLTVTADSIIEEIDENGVSSIKEIRDMQIVNGGQTTVSLYRAKKDKTTNVDFSKVFVQMKLSVISDNSDMDEIIPYISRYSNTQNPVQLADFSSNDPYHRKLEQLSRKTWTPSINGAKPLNWFYERTRGQYAERYSNEATTPAQQKSFKETYLPITKTDLAKVIFCWDMRPEIVSLGAQKCFSYFSEQMKKNETIVPTVDYYQHLISKVILFKKIEKIVSAQRFGGYKANIVAYTYYKLMSLTDKKIDLNQIWKTQNITEALEGTITELCKLVQSKIVNSSGGNNIGELCKTHKCIDLVDDVCYELNDKMKSELLSAPVLDDLIEEGEEAAELTDEQRAIVNEAKNVLPSEWRSIYNWAKDGNVFEAWERTLILRITTSLDLKKAPSFVDADKGLDLREEAIGRGFILQ